MGVAAVGNRQADVLAVALLDPLSHFGDAPQSCAVGTDSSLSPSSSLSASQRRLALSAIGAAGAPGAAWPVPPPRPGPAENPAPDARRRPPACAPVSSLIPSPVVATIGTTGQPRRLRQLRRVDMDATLARDIHHVQRHHQRHAHLEQLHGEVEIAFEVGRVDDIDAPGRRRATAGSRG